VDMPALPAPATIPVPTGRSLAAEIAAPARPPSRTRPSHVPGAVRAGVIGSLSATASAATMTAQVALTAGWLRKARGLRRSGLLPGATTQLTTATGVIERTPAATPRRAAEISPSRSILCALPTRSRDDTTKQACPSSIWPRPAIPSRCWTQCSRLHGDL
jgi:hypothetical protein